MTTTDPMPVFTIKGKDEFAVDIVQLYAALCREHGLDDQGAEVDKAADELMSWRMRHPDLIKLPDHRHVPVAADGATS